MCTASGAKPFNLSLAIAALKSVLILRNVLKDHSASYKVTGKIIMYIDIFLALGKITGFANSRADCEESGRSFLSLKNARYQTQILLMAIVN